ncbi:MAG: bifunctional (p)ppGpp synthetase/guanosine-3',5'-bis(diphosphate) 3'-pyrophosphohydrolase [Oscillospiraceae bacterium]|jgi:guanosine-3',5'-bis(diphosphate) 3'-pyrophosphohydrolase|nr:bifunctional (p)ppGpp synthetase/guanosine-3',5'-bis(diphosphate) 3'-pyrophosphohydrolase [Oscillospiraceae bacterium]
MDLAHERYAELERHIVEANPATDTARIRAAFEYANDHHGPQLRKSGEPYIIHPIAVAEIINELELDQDSIVAALLHDCIEDTDSTHDEIARLFGPQVADLVEGVTKLTRMQYTSREDEQMENLRKMFVAMAKDVRVILIKLCDRLHNMRTLQYQSDKKQKEKSLETMEVYAPIAHRLGMQKLKWELEDLALKYLDPVGYHDVEQALRELTQENSEFLERMQAQIEERLQTDGLHCKVYGRLKHLYSIYRKMYAQNKTIKEIFDIYAFRVMVDDIPSCYNVLGCIHDMFKPVLGRFKDYIGTPKPNGYQSLHTTVVGREAIPFEVQIRTWQMHQTAEYGVAAHWKYKEGMANEKLGTEREFEWVRKLLESQQDADPDEFVRTLRVDMFSDEVFVFTPNGDVKSLPAGATPIDFAYSIHSAVGNSMTGARVNGRIVTFETPLKNGDIVEIITSKNAHGPSRDWMKICKSNEARNKIRQWYKKERRDENIATGRASFETELKHAGLSIAAITATAELTDTLLRRVRFGSLDELYAAIGYGGMSAQKAVGRMKEELTRLGRLERQRAEQEALRAAASTGEAIFPAGKAGAAPRPRHSDSGIIVEGLDNCMVKFSKCCTPVPGDPVVGFITKGYGVSIHRQDCPNADPARRKPEEAGRWVKVSWADAGEDAHFRTSLDISAKDRDGLTLDVAMVLSAQKVRLNNISARSQPDGYAMVNLEMSVKDKAELSAVINKLSAVPGVCLVRRAGG